MCSEMNVISLESIFIQPVAIRRPLYLLIAAFIPYFFRVSGTSCNRPICFIYSEFFTAFR
jgi:hypothetical protein